MNGQSTFGSMNGSTSAPIIKTFSSLAELTEYIRANGGTVVSAGSMPGMPGAGMAGAGAISTDSKREDQTGPTDADDSNEEGEICPGCGKVHANEAGGSNPMSLLSSILFGNGPSFGDDDEPTGPAGRDNADDDDDNGGNDGNGDDDEPTDRTDDSDSKTDSKKDTTPFDFLSKLRELRELQTKQMARQKAMNDLVPKLVTKLSTAISASPLVSKSTANAKALRKAIAQAVVDNSDNEDILADVNRYLMRLIVDADEAPDADLDYENALREADKIANAVVADFTPEISAIFESGADEILSTLKSLAKSKTVEAMGTSLLSEAKFTASVKDVLKSDDSDKVKVNQLLRLVL
ncbi:hypothetical protein YASMINEVIRUS_1537 [Yasminevirus sp. GU-2018]|uniref:Uncharacterized protein n=1 Tax=Yasminevirus sp. GU-2018 TaxID=2420051 RepID=A0A5K0UBA9_9VIRU|nr:hypothetical protein YASMINEVIRUS_1537 [Yasminevirus sp. GU-2018]